MNESNDLTGTVDDRIQQLADTPPDAQTEAWLRRQLDAALASWATAQTKLDIDSEGSADF